MAATSIEEWFLIKAAKDGSLEDVQRYLSSGVDVNCQRERGHKGTPLYLASEGGHTEVLELLLKYNADPNITRHNCTSLYCASSKGHTEIVELLLKYNADPNRSGYAGQTPLYVAASSYGNEADHTEVVKLLLKYNADPNISDNINHLTPLHVAHNIVIAECLINNGADINALDKYFGQSPLHKASKAGGQIEVVKLLLKYNADPNISDKINQTPLHVARNEVVAGCLIDSGAGINTLDKYGRTPLYEAASWWRCTDHPELVKLLLKYNADPNISDNMNGRTPLYWASKEGRTEEVKLMLLEYNADPNIRNKHGQTPLHVAGNEIIAECLINSGADINALDIDGCTPLNEASSNGHAKIVKLLLKYDGDLNVSNKYGWTPLHVAGNEVTAKCLINSGADINTLDNYLNTALHVACASGYKNVVQYLVEIGASLEKRNKDDVTPIDILKIPLNDNDDPLIAEGRRNCLEWLKTMGYLESASAVPIADLSTEISSSSPSIDKMDSYGLSLDVDPSSLSSQGSPILADIKVFTVDDDDEVSTPSFTFPEETKPVSAVYTISLSDTHIPVRTLRIRHCADSNNPEELKQLMFVKSSENSSKDFEVVPGGIFSPGEQYGEITLHTQRVSSMGYSIARRVKKIFSKKAQYVGMVLYRNVKQFQGCWLMDFIVGKNDPKTMVALNEYITSKCGHDVVKEPEFIFTFEESDQPKLGLTTTAKDERVLKCRNGWEISLDIYEISKNTVDHFKRSTDVPGRCSLKIHTHMNVCHELALLPTVILNGIISDRKDIQINPPIPDSITEFERDYTNVRPQLKIMGSVPPSVEAVFDLMKCYSARWNEFARALRISHNDRQILYYERISADARLERVIYQWIESECSPVTWGYLIDVLRRIGLQDVIDVIEESQQPESIPESQPESIPESQPESSPPESAQPECNPESQPELNSESRQPLPPESSPESQTQLVPESQLKSVQESHPESNNCKESKLAESIPKSQTEFVPDSQTDESIPDHHSNKAGTSSSYLTAGYVIISSLVVLLAIGAAASLVLLTRRYKK